MKLERTIEILERHQEWRRGESLFEREMQSPIELGTAIDYALTELKNLHIARVVKRYTISYTTRKGKGIKVIDIDADSETNALGKFCLEVPLGLWVQIRSEDE